MTAQEAYNKALNAKKRLLELEPIILHDIEYSYLYARHVIKERWPEAETYLLKLKSVTYSYYYTRYVIKKRWLEAEPNIAKDEYWAFYYARDIMRERWSEAEEDILNHVESVDLLVIDDFGVENMTSWTYEKIFNLIDKRYRTGKACIITTNLNYSKDTTENELAIKFKDEFGNNRISDRINEMCYPMLIEGESRRKPDKNRFMEFLS